MFLLHLSLSLVLAALAGHLHGWGALSAFALLYLLCKLAWPSVRLRQYARRVELGSRFIPWFIGQVALASLQVARLVLAQQVAVEPAIVAVRLRSRNANMVTLIGGLLTLTPGTLALDYRAADDTLFIHVLDARQPMDVENMVRNLESRLLHWLEPAATGERR